MSAHTREQLVEDRALRDAARALLKADLARVRGDLAAKSIGERAKDRITEGAIDLYEEAADMAEDNKGILAALVGAIALWFARNPIVSLFSDREEEDEASEDYDDRYSWPERFRRSGR